MAKDFFKRVEPEIRELYDKFETLSSNEFKNLIDLDYTYGYGRIDEPADYKDGWEQLHQELHARIDFSNRTFEPYEHDRIGIRIIVDQTGAIEECEVVSFGFPEDLGTIIENTVIEIGNWKPTVLYGFRVRSNNMLSFPLSLN